MTQIIHDRKWQAEQRARQRVRLEVLQSRADKVFALGCMAVLILVIVALVIWPGLAMH